MKKVDGYCMVVDVEYEFSGIVDKEIFNITHEKIRSSEYIYYERFFINTKDTICISENYKVLGIENLKKLYMKDFWKRILLYDYNIFAYILTVILIYIGIILSNIFGLLFSFIYFPIIYLGLVLFGLLLKQFNRINLFGGDIDIYVDKKYFYKYFDSDYLKSYYSSIPREPYMPGEIEFKNKIGILLVKKHTL